MTAIRDLFTYCHPGGGPCMTARAIVDTGSDLSVVSQSLAQQLGLPIGPAQVVNTGGGLTPMYRSQVRIGPVGGEARVVECWINGSGDNEVTVGANALRALGYQLIPPEAGGAATDAMDLEDTPTPPETAEVPAEHHAIAEGTLAASRQAVCASCSHRSSFLGIATCTVCGCPLATKTRLASSSCPLGRW